MLYGGCANFAGRRFRAVFSGRRDFADKAGEAFARSARAFRRRRENFLSFFSDAEIFRGASFVFLNGGRSEAKGGERFERAFFTLINK